MAQADTITSNGSSRLPGTNTMESALVLAVIGSPADRPAWYPHTPSQFRTLHSTVRYRSTAHRTAPYALLSQYCTAPVALRAPDALSIQRIPQATHRTIRYFSTAHAG
eukprot:1918634-Rhodomonas_salina.1